MIMRKMKRGWRCLSAMVLLMAIAVQVEGMQISWSEKPKGENAPLLVPFREGKALRFSSADAKWIDLGKGEGRIVFRSRGR